MYLLVKNPPAESVYPPVQQMSVESVPEGWIAFPEKWLSCFYPVGKLASGFVRVTHDDTTVTDCVWDENAYQAWLAAQPTSSAPLTKDELPLE